MISAIFSLKALQWMILLLAMSGLVGQALADSATLSELRREAKFVATEWYVGPDTPQDGRALTELVNRAIDDVISLPSPHRASELRNRLQKLVTDVDLFATEDRDQLYRYVVRIWRAAGFAEESQLFPVSDDGVLREP
jgi:hypothetical protein